ncbi:hypothetical protein A9179_07645 [Pseudomonas alcaligenes]|uniref:Hpr(Ser) kinase/phosphatase n=1 Tax=Aquipseudomonas alcaligenes TaxID=43263 RepID=A0ABR7RZC1_AQUAC|nr:hypothetical protein [Pseudomonas alcaligenes]MBC9250144.1 hypothetical protein [Pseudomonas alcaligenes]
MSLHFYQAYALTIHSELALPELLGTDPSMSPAMCDVLIRFGRAAAPVAEGPLEQLSAFAWARPGLLKLDVPGIASFLVCGGCEITVEPAVGSDEASIRAFLLGSALGALLMQRGLLVMHGNAIRIGDRCMLCVGHSGAGKSTLAAAFTQRGYALLADDVIPIDGKGCALPGVPRVKLWPDSAAQLGLDVTRLDAIRPGVNKFTLPVHQSMTDLPLPVGWIYVLTAGETPSLSAVRGMRRFELLQGYGYRPRFVAGLGLQKEQLLSCSRLANQAQMSELVRKRDHFDLNGLVDSLLADMQEACV